MKTLAISYLGWVATSFFVASYFFVRPALLRTTQMLGALLWVLYGALIGAAPVVVSNVLVIAAAGCTILRRMTPPVAKEAPRI